MDTSVTSEEVVPAPPAQALSSRQLRKMKASMEAGLLLLKQRFGIGTSKAALARRTKREYGFAHSVSINGVVTLGDTKYTVARSGEFRRTDLPWNPSLTRKQRKEIAKQHAQAA